MKKKRKEKNRLRSCKKRKKMRERKKNRRKQKKTNPWYPLSMMKEKKEGVEKVFFQKGTRFSN